MMLTDYAMPVNCGAYARISSTRSTERSSTGLTTIWPIVVISPRLTNRTKSDLSGRQRHTSRRCGPILLTFQALRPQVRLWTLTTKCDFFILICLVIWSRSRNGTGKSGPSIYRYAVYVMLPTPFDTAPKHCDSDITLKRLMATA